MEVPTRFVVPDLESLHRLENAHELGGFPIGHGRRVHLSDRCLDTESYDLLAVGLCCLCRNGDGATTLVLKEIAARDRTGAWTVVATGPGAVAGPLPLRQELKHTLSRMTSPADLPAGPVRDALLGTVGRRLLRELFDVRTERLTRPIQRDGRSVVELRLDRVRIATGRGGEDELEAGLGMLAEGNEADLASISDAVRDEWRLRPVSRSKFARAFALASGLSADRVQELLEDQQRRPAPAAATMAAPDRAASEPGSAEEDVPGAAPTPAELDPAGRARSSSNDAGAPSASKSGGLGFVASIAGHALTAPEPTGPMKPPSIAAPISVGSVSAGSTASALQEAAASADRDGAAPPGESNPSPDLAAPTTLQTALKARAKPGIAADDDMAEAARKTLLVQFERMRAHEEGTRAGTDPEELHDMRVATRRMRAALRIFEGHLDPDLIRPHARALRRTGRRLGAVRDLDVFGIKARLYIDELSAGHGEDLDPLLDAWRRERDSARARLLAHLDGTKYETLKAGFAALLRGSGSEAQPTLSASSSLSSSGEPRMRLVRHVLPAVLYARMGAVRAFEEWLAGDDAPLARYHRLRIAAKGLRYTLEFFSEVLGPGADPLIEHVKRLQDHLGELQDAAVSCDIISTFLTWGSWRAPDSQTQHVAGPWLLAPGVAKYLAHRQEEIERLVAGFPPVWDAVRGPAFTRRLGELAAAL